MHMKASKIIGIPSDFQTGEEVEFQLTGVLSEWLFATRFWQSFNTTHSTMFDQFEEDEVTADVVRQVAASIGERIAEIHASDVQSVQFVYRRLRDGTPVPAQMFKKDLIDEMTRLRDFLSMVAERYTMATFEL